MGQLWIPIACLIGGFIALVWSADRFLSGAAAIASNMGVSKMLIGLTVVAVGTSAPEILVALTAAIEGNPLLAVGNAIGSNIANIGLVLGVTAIIAPLPFAESVLKTELPWLLAATLLVLFLMFNLHLSRVDGLLMFAGLGLVLTVLMRAQMALADGLPDTIADELDELPDMDNRPAILWTIAGLVVLLISAEVLVWAASNIANALGVSELIIGLTVVAVGTSLPELAATVGSALKGHPEIAIGNVVGSNLLNILAVLPIPALVSSVALEPAALWRDGGMMLALTIALFLFAYGLNSRPIITRFEGAVMLAGWIGYNLLLIMEA